MRLVQRPDIAAPFSAGGTIDGATLDSDVSERNGLGSLLQLIDEVHDERGETSGWTSGVGAIDANPHLLGGLL